MRHHNNPEQSRGQDSPSASSLRIMKYSAKDFRSGLPVYRVFAVQQVFALMRFSSCWLQSSIPFGHNMK